MLNLPINYETAHWSTRKRARLQYINEQKGLCHHCGAPLVGPPAPEVEEKEVDWKLFPPNFLSHPIHLHHDHKTGMTIGAVHAQCNAVLWVYYGE